MVHALSEARRVLCIGGALIDLRPTARNRLVELERRGQRIPVGEIDSSNTAGDKLRASQSLAAAVERRWFRAEHQALFETVLEMDGLDDLRDFARGLRRSVMPAELPRRIAELGAGDRDSLIRVRREMTIARYRRL